MNPLALDAPLTLTLKYRLTRDDGVEIDVPGSVWESVLELGYRGGWRPSGTDAPGTTDRGMSKASMFGGAPAITGGRWVSSDYFSACCQHVRAADARELGTAAMRGSHDRANGSDPSDSKRDAGVRKVANFAQDGGFVIGRAPKSD
jgi:hypothetical protein